MEGVAPEIPPRLATLIADSLEMYTGLPSGDGPSKFLPVTLWEITPILYFRTERGGTGTVVVRYTKAVLEEADLRVAHARMAELVRDLQGDPGVWGYSAIVAYHWPGGLRRGEPAQDG